MKTCSRCKVEKPFEDFRKCERTADGWQSYCRVCSNLVTKLHRHEKAAKKKELARIKFLVSRMKTCPQCNVEKPLSEFHRDKTKKNGIHTYCKECKKVERKEWYADPENREKDLARRKVDSEKSRNTLEGYLRSLSHIKTRNRNGNVKHSRSFDLHTLLALYHDQGGKCALTGLEMTHIAGKGRISTNISIDRIDSSKGYDIDNIRLVCSHANVMKNNLDDKELYEWCAAILSKNK